MKEVVEKYQQNALEAQPGRTIHESFEAQVRMARLSVTPPGCIVVPWNVPMCPGVLECAGSCAAHGLGAVTVIGATVFALLKLYPLFLP